MDPKQTDPHYIDIRDDPHNTVSDIEIERPRPLIDRGWYNHYWEEEKDDEDRNK